jgi:hypothetical protein
LKFANVILDLARIVAIVGALVNLVALFRRYGASPGMLVGPGWFGAVVWYTIDGSYASPDPSLGLFLAALASLSTSVIRRGIGVCSGLFCFDSYLLPEFNRPKRGRSDHVAREPRGFAYLRLKAARAAD